MELVKVFFDANVLISALVFDGNELEAIFNARKEGHELLISEHIEEEIFRVMLEKFPEHSKLLHEFISLADFEIVPREKYTDKINDYNMVRDKHDRHVLACAKTANCNFIISGDKDLLVLKKLSNIRILNAKDFIDLLK